MGEFKSSKSFSINLSDSRLDNAQYLLLSIFNKFKVNIEDSTTSVALNQITKTLLSQLTNNSLGISIGSMTNAFGNFEFFLNGMSKIYTPTGIRILEATELEKYLTGSLDIKTLHFETKAYISVINHSQPSNYYGVFYSLKDAIKICSENDLVKVGEITS